MKKYLFIFTLLFVGNLCLQADDRDRLLRDLDIIKSIFETRYAPFEWKKEYSGWSLNEEIDKAKSKIDLANHLTVHDYQKILHSFFVSTCDYHVTSQYHSTEMALLPFSVRSADGHYYISNVKFPYLQEMQQLGLYQGNHLPNVGDELIIFDDRPVNEVITQLKQEELGNPTAKTSQLLAEEILTQRLRALGHQVPQGTIRLQFKKNQGEIVDAEIEWVYEPEMIANRPLRRVMFATPNLAERPVIEPTIESLPEIESVHSPMIAINPIAETLREDQSKHFRKFFDKAVKLNDLPDYSTTESDTRGTPQVRTLDRDILTLGKKVWQENIDSPFKAYIYESPTKRKRIGYVRISTYHPATTLNSVNTTAMQLANVLRFFQNNTDGLVVDQIDNPGGFLIYAYAILAMLSDKPLVGMQHQVAITQEDVVQAFNNIEEFAKDLQMSRAVGLCYGYPYSADFLKGQIANSEFIISEWEAGKNLTGNTPVEGLSIIEPHPQAHYSKPILMLVDSRAYSSADVVPAILQDNQRAVIFGEQTAGAGGVLKTHSYPNIFGLAKFSFTGSILERPNGGRLENLGVTPDVAYEITTEDLLFGYRQYIKAVNEVIESMLK